MEETIEEFAHTGTATRLYDAVNLTIVERLNRIKGRKAIVLFTDGVDTASQQASYQSTLEQVEELDALIYPVQYDTSDYMRAMQGSGQGTVTVTTTRRGRLASTSSTQTYNAPANSGAPMPGTTKEDYDRANVNICTRWPIRPAAVFIRRRTRNSWPIRSPPSLKSCAGNTRLAITRRPRALQTASVARFVCACANRTSR